MKNRVVIIAEAGVNHNGSLKRAFELVDAALDSGVDYVKFQTFKSEKLVSKTATKADYQVINTNNKIESQLEMLQKLELSKDDHEKLINYCNSKGINFFSTAFDLDSLQYLADVGLRLVKIPSGEITNLPYLRKAADLFDEVILSTGMSTLLEVRNAFDVFIRAGIPKNKITILHCNTEYPTPMDNVNLMAMNFIGKEFGVSVGYSDHTIGIEIPIAAVALGATIIEKHFTLDKTLEGPDHKASLNPEELRAMTNAIRNIELAISGSGLKEPSFSELKNIQVARKSIHLVNDMKEGDVINSENIEMLRPGDGISPMRIDEVLGKRLNKDLNAGSKLSMVDLVI